MHVILLVLSKFNMQKYCMLKHNTFTIIDNTFLISRIILLLYIDNAFLMCNIIKVLYPITFIEKEVEIDSPPLHQSLPILRSDVHD